jgi:hypothetical protein
MTDCASRYDTDVLQYAQNAITWYGRGSAVDLSLFIPATGGFVALLPLAAVIP